MFRLLTSNLKRIGKRRLILHAGASKTGSSALQHYLAERRPQLIEHGILYPSAGLLKRPLPPKHQWMVDCLIGDNETEFKKWMSLVEQECGAGVHTIILSTEGIFNHWWDYAENTKQWFRRHLASYDAKCWIWLREPVDFFRSYYLQLMRNPNSPFSYGAQAYSSNKTPSELLNEPWVVKHLDYLGLCRQLEETFGNDSVFVFSYSNDIVSQARQLLGLKFVDGPGKRENTTIINDAGLSILHIINRYHLTEIEKEKAYHLVIGLSTLLSNCSEPVHLSEEDCLKIRQLCNITDHRLEEIGRQSIEKWEAIYSNQPSRWYRWSFNTFHRRAG
jgi:hypothetical protein